MNRTTKCFLQFLHSGTIKHYFCLCNLRINSDKNNTHDNYCIHKQKAENVTLQKYCGVENCSDTDQITFEIHNEIHANITIRIFFLRFSKFRV